MNTATNIIYKAKDFTGQWATGWYYPDGSTHIIKTAKRETIEVNPETLCIGCVIDGKEYFAGDRVRVRGTKNTGIYETEIIWTGTMFRFLENKTYINDGFILPSLIIEITGNIHD